MSLKDRDVQKDIEDLEKLIEQVKNQNREERKRQKNENKPPKGNVIRIDLAQRYSPVLWVHLLTSFLMNFILIYFVNVLFQFADIQNEYYYVLIAFAFTGFEEVYRNFLLKKHLKVVLYSSGLIFFLINIIFFYLLDLVVLPQVFSFVDYLYPILFVFIFQLVRLVFKSIYLRISRYLLMKSQYKK